ncbi:helix-turn-helix domain-containing protein [Spirillospora sp. NPDC047279]|uniref:helix-turn-helix domain-containing protein n=1 Tax=Spirillospora sp. NPDC047279 TaxID=3155478 RepID=UPI003402735D
MSSPSKTPCRSTTPTTEPATAAGASPDHLSNPSQKNWSNFVEMLKYKDLLDLPAVVDIMTAARALGLSRTYAYQLARKGRFPCRVIRIGSCYRVPTADLLTLLGATFERTQVDPPS